MSYISIKIRGYDQGFLNRVVEDSSKCGFINLPGNWRRQVTQEQTSFRLGGVDLCCFCCIGGGRNNDKTAVALAIVVFVLSFFVGVYYTSNSVQSAVQAREDLKQVDSRIKELDAQLNLPQFQQQRQSPPSYQYNSSQPFQYSQQYSDLESSFQDSNPTQQTYPNLRSQSTTQALPQEETPIDKQKVKSLYEKAKIILINRRDERMAAALSQGFMTAGAGLITVALLIVLVAEPEISTIAIGGAGVLCVTTGAFLWLRKSTKFTKGEAQDAAQVISDALFSSPKETEIFDT